MLKENAEWQCNSVTVGQHKKHQDPDETEAAKLTSTLIIHPAICANIFL